MNKPSLFLSAALALGACAKNDVPAESPAESHFAQNRSVTGNADPSHKPSVSEKQKERLAGLIAAQIELHDQAEKMDSGVRRICMQIHDDCMTAYSAMFRKNIPADVRHICAGTLNDTKSSCVDDEMIERGKADELIEVYESGNTCLRKIVTDCAAKMEAARRIEADPVFDAERKKQAEIRKRIAGLKPHKFLSWGDWMAHDLIDKRNSQNEEKKLHDAFYENPTAEGFRLYMEAHTRLMEADEKRFSDLIEEGKQNPAIAKLLAESQRYSKSDVMAPSRCVDNNPEFELRDNAWHAAIAAYAENPSTVGRIKYLEAEIARYKFLEACIKGK
jgi:hypothetical protein